MSNSVTKALGTQMEILRARIGDLEAENARLRAALEKILRYPYLEGFVGNTAREALISTSAPEAT